MDLISSKLREKSQILNMLYTLKVAAKFSYDYRQQVHVFATQKDFDLLFDLAFLKNFLAKEGLINSRDASFQKAIEKESVNPETEFKKIFQNIFSEKSFQEFSKEKLLYQNDIWQLIPNALVQLLNKSLKDFSNSAVSSSKNETKVVLQNLALLDNLLKINLFQAYRIEDPLFFLDENFSKKFFKDERYEMKQYFFICFRYWEKLLRQKISKLKT